MDVNRQQWNNWHKALRVAMKQAAAPHNTTAHSKALELFLRVHGMVHTAQVSDGEVYSLEDEVWQGLGNPAAKYIDPASGHSIAWMFWHLTRIEDITMNVLVAGCPQLFHTQGWQERMGVHQVETGNGMSPDEITRLTADINVQALRAYRSVVGRNTRAVISALPQGAFEHKPHADGLAQIVADGSVTVDAVIDYWGGLDVAGLLLMPPTRHNLVHINEALKIKSKAMKNTSAGD